AVEDPEEEPLAGAVDGGAAELDALGEGDPRPLAGAQVDADERRLLAVGDAAQEPPGEHAEDPGAAVEAAATGVPAAAVADALLLAAGVLVVIDEDQPDGAGVHVRQH